LYQYAIDLLAVERGTVAKADFSEDLSMIQKIKGSINTAKAWVRKAKGVVQDLTALAADMKNTIKNVSAIIDDAAQVISALEDFVAGVTDFIEIPYATLQSTIHACEEIGAVIDRCYEVGDAAKAFPATVKQLWAQLGDVCEQIGSDPANFRAPWEKAIKDAYDQAATRALARDIAIRTEANAALADADSVLQNNLKTVSKMSDYNTIGTAFTPGELAAVSGGPEDSQVKPKYRSAREVTLGEGDTLGSLAARYLGDARLWQQIAQINGLQPPFIDSQAGVPLVGMSITGAATGADEYPLVGTLGVGGKILIPSNLDSPLNQTLLPVLGVELTEPVEAQFCGTDLLLEPVGTDINSSRTLYDVPINVIAGGVDAQTTTGYDNLAQMIRTRLLIEKGEDIMYQNVGVARIAGMGFQGLDRALIQFRIREALMADPRILEVSNIDIAQNVDSLDITVEAQVRGLTESRAVRVAL
jgi:hypothetical protein